MIHRRQVSIYAIFVGYKLYVVITQDEYDIFVIIHQSKASEAEDEC